MDDFLVADLFCGAGGFSSGCLDAGDDVGCRVRILAINHWNIAIDTHSANHPEVEHRCENLDGVDPTKAVPGGYLNLLLASPECTHHSRARGGKPMSDQSRATAWHILRWATALYIEHIIVENVVEFQSWGPLNKEGRPIKSKEGSLFRNFIRGLKAAGYRVEYRVLCAADYGDATTRRRLIIQARRGNKKIVWPEPTHAPREKIEFCPAAKPYRPAREIIDWSLPGTSIFNRDVPIAANTMKRIVAGFRKFSGIDLEPFIISMEQYGSNGCCARSIDSPLATITTKGQFGLIQPCVVVLRNHADAISIDDPLPTVCAKGTHLALAEPFLIQYNEGDARRAKSLDEPLPTVTTEPRFGLVKTCLINMKGQSIGRSLEEPVPTITAGAPHLYLASFLMKYYGTGGARSVDEPIDTITTKDRFGLVSPIIVETPDGPAMLDILLRMLKPHELAAAMGFPKTYYFAGNQSQQVRQVGNAIPVGLARALCKTAMVQTTGNTTYAKAA